ncbi:MAG: bifunctional glutamate N-acetyltransferase/amino-acid acetyltransferase ArgJ [Phycisphaeraceae bacterium]|nr:MAG: bifunctional glutamate N-acetyltransferase/amino-acid acetyltransferase ArgJ [Phycisphaeraceae bacterium]
MSDPIRIELDVAECPPGFEAGGITCGLRKSGRPDLAVFLCRNGASAAGVFTQNLVRAACIEICIDHLKDSGGRVRALVINSGNANAATGAEGRRRAERTAIELAKALECPVEETLVSSTGVIGVQLPVDTIIDAYPMLLESASPDGLPAAGRAILTTDTCSKSAQATVTREGRTFRVAGVAKGSGMIHPNMATMIAVMLTDAAVEPPALQRMLTSATNRTFNRITVDGDTSTNDGAYLFASGEAGEFPESLVAEAIERVSKALALMIVRDGEGARKVIHVLVSGGADEPQARRVAQTVASSLLVRTAVTGGDPNWGRILAAAGRAGVPIDPARIRLSAVGVPLFANGAPVDSPRDALIEAFRGPDVELEIDLGEGDARGEFYTCDLTEGYIHINADYTT